MNMPPARPEDRHRDGSDKPVWADTVPACFRSEAFAEDLMPADEFAAARGVTAPGGSPRRDHALVPQLGLVPQFGLALAPMIALLRR